MSSPPVRHPDDRILVAFKLSKLDQRQIALTNKHLHACPECRQRLKRLSAELERPGDFQPPDAAVPATGPQVPFSKRAAALRFRIALSVAGLAVLALFAAWCAGAFDANSQARRAPALATTLTESRPSGPNSMPDKVADPPAKSDAARLQSEAAQVADRSAPHGESQAPSRSVETPSPAASSSASKEIKDVAAASGAHPKNKAEEEAAEPFRGFFNGRDLTGWQGAPGTWHVAEGSIISLPASGPTRSLALVSRKTYKDFDLMFQASLEDGIGDCALQFRARAADGENLRIDGPLCVISGKQASTDRRTGSLILEPAGKVLKAPKRQRAEHFIDSTENYFHIRCEGRQVLIEVNGVPMVYGDFPSLPEDGVIAWKLDPNRRPRKATFKIIRFTDLSRTPPSSEILRPSVSDFELLTAEVKFETALRKADETLLGHFDAEIARLKRSGRDKDQKLIETAEHEKEVFKARGLVPWSRPMRKWLAQYGRELHDAQKTVGAAFDAAIDRAEKKHDEKLLESLVAEAGQVLAPHEVAAWQHTGKSGKVHRRVFYSDGTFTQDDQESNPLTRFWSPPVNDIVILESPDSENTTETKEQSFLLSVDGETLTTQSKNETTQIWRRTEDPAAKDSPLGHSGDSARQSGP